MVGSCLLPYNTWNTTGACVKLSVQFAFTFQAKNWKKRDGRAVSGRYYRCLHTVQTGSLQRTSSSSALIGLIRTNFANKRSLTPDASTGARYRTVQFAFTLSFWVLVQMCQYVQYELGEIEIWKANSCVSLTLTICCSVWSSLRFVYVFLSTLYRLRDGRS